jgi:hypothetical protein
MLHVFIGEILANMTQVSDVAPGPLVYFCDYLPFEENLAIYLNKFEFSSPKDNLFQV